LLLHVKKLLILNVTRNPDAVMNLFILACVLGSRFSIVISCGNKVINSNKISTLNSGFKTF